MQKIERMQHLFSTYFSGKPAYLILFATSRCNARCKMCFNWKKQDEEHGRHELSLNEIDKISKSFKNLLQFTVTGGEPFIRDDIPEIVKCFYSNSGARLITIPTNAYFTDKVEDAVSRILNECPSCLLNVGLSLDGIGEDHDSIRQLPGSFERLIQTLDRLNRLKKKHNNFYIKITTVLSNHNQHNIEKLFDFVKDNFLIDEHEILLARGSTRDQTAPDVPWRKYSDLLKKTEEHAAENVKKRRYQFSRVFYGLYKHMNQVVSSTIKDNKMVYPCLAGKRLIEIYDDGLVVPCEILQPLNPGTDMSFGNIRDFDYDIHKVMRSPAARKILAHIKTSKCHCSFECAILTNIVFNPYSYPRLLKNILSG